MLSSALLPSFLQEAHLALLALLTILTILVVGAVRMARNPRHLAHIPGPMPLPIVGNALLFNRTHPEVFMDTIAGLVQVHGPTWRFHLGHRPNVGLSTPEAFEKILSSKAHITKGRDYKFLWPWLETGLLTSTGEKWHSRRKLLTPTFHFKILESFLEVINDQSRILCDDVLLALADGLEFDIFPLVTHCALDIICETAMGRSIGAQRCSDQPYVSAVYQASDLVNKRQLSPWLWPDWVFALSPLGAKMRGVLKVLHGFTEKVIAEKKEEWQVEREEALEGNNNQDSGQKRRLAFLDLLLESSQGGTVLSDRDIREEVDTFMFEGHDTTATNMSFTLWLLASHPEVQARCVEELEAIFEGDQERPATSQDLAAMKYLDTCLKESLRLYQSVPIISRILGEDLEVDGMFIPANTNAILFPFLLHRDPKTFPDPNRFDPERFSLENQQGRHPYSYVPFSAGPRNCIGQKFATMEEKVIISSVLRKFTLRSTMAVSEIPLCAEIILRPQHGLRVSLTPR